MIRLIQLLLLIALAVIAWRLLRKALGPPADAPDTTPKFEPTARCTKCGTHVPRNELDAAGLCARCQGL